MIVNAQMKTPYNNALLNTTALCALRQLQTGILKDTVIFLVLQHKLWRK